MVLVVIPAYNEEKQIGRVIRGLFEQGFKEVVVVDDGSFDKTFDTAIKAGAKVLRHEVNRGQGAALETGNAYARLIGAELVVHFDADGQFDPKDITPAIEFMKARNLDLVFGSRFLDSRSKVPLFKKRFLLPVSRWINFVFTGSLLTDAHNGFRVLNRFALNKIRITQDRMAHNTEIVQKVRKNKLSYGEFPVRVFYHEYGQGAAQGFKIIEELLIGLFS